MPKNFMVPVPFRDNLVSFLPSITVKWIFSSLGMLVAFFEKPKRILCALGNYEGNFPLFLGLIRVDFLEYFSFVFSLVDCMSKYEQRQCYLI